MSDFEYKVSVIVPVYNMEDFIDSCMMSLLNQTIDFSDIEIIFINDGSKDNSSIVIKRYQNMYPNVKLFEKENGGVSSARNAGIRVATGKYLLYLDADDELSECTIEEVTAFFDTVYDQVDLCTYKLARIQNGKRMKDHFRYQYMNKTGVYELEETPFITQSHMCVVVKNEKNIFFDENLSLGEDQLYITSILMKKNTIGFCEKGEYRYIRHADSAMSSSANIINMFEQRMNMFEQLIDQSNEENSKYVQGIILGNWCWELRSDLIFPYHYQDNEYEKAYERIRKVIDFLDVDMIRNHPDIDNFHKHFFISMKRNINPTVISNDKKIQILLGEINLYSRDSYEIVLESVDIENNKAIIRGFIKSPVFSYGINPKLFVMNNEKIDEVDLFKSINSCYKSKMETNRFYGFICELPITENNNITFSVEIDGMKYLTDFYLLPTMIINEKIDLDSYFREDYKISVNGNAIQINKCSEETIEKVESKRKIKLAENSQIDFIRKNGIDYRKKKRVWLYVDSFSVRYDNSYYQFIHDFGKKDDVERWYIWSRDDDMSDLFSEEQLAYVVKANSINHKILYIAAEYIFASFSDMKPRVPFDSETEWSYYRDICKGKTIYMQHGVCHADLRYTQSAERRKVDKIVVSTNFEKDNYINNYHYREEDIIPTAMARYDFIDRSKHPQNIILFAPSWRSYLTGEIVDGKRQINTNMLLNSDYYSKYMEFLNSDKLTHFLEENDLQLDAKLHQNMVNAIDEFELQSNRVHLVREDVHVEDYLIFITDISSYLYDFLCLERPIIYFMPDLKQFNAGMNGYRKLHIQFEDGFGNLCEDGDMVVAEMEKIRNNSYLMEDIFKERLRDFYLPLDNCREKLYHHLMEN